MIREGNVLNPDNYYIPEYSLSSYRRHNNIEKKELVRLKGLMRVFMMSYFTVAFVRRCSDKRNYFSMSDCKAAILIAVTAASSPS